MHKKLSLIQASLVVSILMLLASAIVPLRALAEYPFLKSLTLSGGTNGSSVTWLYTNGVVRDAYTVFRIDAIEVIPAATLTNAFTVTPKRSRAGGVSNQVYGTVTVGSNTSYISVSITNTVWNFRNDKLIFDALFTNAGTIYLSGVEW